MQRYNKPSFFTLLRSVVIFSTVFGHNLLITTLNVTLNRVTYCIDAYTWSTVQTIAETMLTSSSTRWPELDYESKVPWLMGASHSTKLLLIYTSTDDLIDARASVPSAACRCLTATDVFELVPKSLPASSNKLTTSKTSCRGLYPCHRETHAC